jgi:hypothetical protein
MNKLLIYIGENQRFDLDVAKRAIGSIHGVSNPRDGSFIGAVFECQYTFAGQTTVIRISDNLETVIVEGLGDEASDFAVKFQKLMPMPLHVIDMDYTFDLDLHTFSSGDELMSAIKQS